MDEKPKNDIEIEKGVMEQIYTEAIVEMGAKDFATFGGFYYEDSNARAKTSGTEITVNEKYLEIPKDEIERISRHETQHAVNRYRFDELGDDQGKALFAFVLHPSFKDLHDRMEQFFLAKRQEGYPFKKTVQPIPTKYSDIGVSAVDYTHPDELLALLSGYKQYLKQIEQGVATTTAPYEFIKAFIPTDLKLLEEQTRFKLATEVLSNDPHILDSVEEEPLVITKEDLA